MATIKEIINNLIGLPGHFIKIDGENKLNPQKVNSGKLDIFKNNKEAKGVYAIYARSFNNAVSLLEEAKLLFQNTFYARAVALALISFEELGKSQIAADYYSGILTKEEYKQAFRVHNYKTSFAGRYGAIVVSKKGNEWGLATNENTGIKLEFLRQSAIYVDENNNPADNFTKEDAEEVIKRVWEHVNYVRYAEEFNGRIGSKALFK